MRPLNTIVVTTSRADYGLLYPLIKKISCDKYFNLNLIVTGSHLSFEFGNTVEEIKRDGFNIFNVVSAYPSGDSERDIIASIAESMKCLSNLIEKSKPDLVIVLGDRYELWPVIIACVIHKIPIAHIHGGETTYGSTDEVVRHSVTKAAVIHFPSIEQYGKRIIQMGEEPKNVFVVGALAIDNIKNIELMHIEELKHYTKLDFNKDIALLTYHPVTQDKIDSTTEQIKNVLDAVLESGITTIITMPNMDVGGRAIYKKINEYVEKYPKNFVLISNLGRVAYLSAMKYAKLMIGNSSSGIIESASFRLPVVNVGDRQEGRYKPINVIDCLCAKNDIYDGITKALSEDFKESLYNLENPYGDGETADRIVNILKTFDFSDKERLLKKRFFDLDIGF
ncbi:MAG: UDP-N-acetylglucosamine 2-epimerase [Bacillota bacterium]|nr:UDP-N-acetylglucosamine 2-epimerase [Bacillota bacterium]